MKIFLFAACAAGFAAIAAAQEPTIQQLNALLRANDLKADVSFLASDALDGRGTPSPGLDIAAEYIAAQFRRAGLEPAGDDGYFQTAHYANVTPVTEGLELSLETGRGTLKARKEAVVLQVPAGADVNNRPVVKVSGIDAAAIAALTPEQVRGNALVFDFPDGANQMLLARQLPALMARLQPAIVVLLRSGATPGNMGASMREVTAAPAVPVLVTWDETVRTALEAGKPGPVNVTLSAHVAPPSTVPVKLHNVIGVLRGSDPVLRDTYVMVTAHYDHLGSGNRCRAAGEDHICNGANDDGSGTASVLEVANTLGGLPSRPKRSIIFMTFFGEELGLVGSRYYGTHPIFPFSKTVADLNLEQLGRTDVDGGSSVGLVNVTGYDFSTLTDAVRKAGDATGIQVVKDAQRNAQYFAQSDNQALADAGVPAHTLSVGYMFPDYHRPGDEWNKLDYENMAKVDRTVVLSVYRVADSVETPQWNKDIPNTDRYIKARDASMGK